MAEPAPSRQRVRFGPYFADLQTGEMLKYGTKLKLQDRPFQILSILLERPGELVTREELRSRLWPDGTFVDFDNNISTAIHKLRAVLVDSAATPRYIETIGRRGYRFIGKLEGANGGSTSGTQLAILQPSIAADGTDRLAGDSVAVALTPIEEAPPAVAIVPPSIKENRRWFSVAAIVLCLLAGVAMWRYATRPIEPHVVKIVQLTRSGTVNANQNVVTDGARIYFLEREKGGYVLKSMPAAGGPSMQIEMGLGRFNIQDISPDNSELLLMQLADDAEDHLLWVAPIVGGQARRLGDIRAVGATYSADGQSVTYSQDGKVWSCDRAGGNAHVLFSVAGEALRLRWSPKGDVLRMVVMDPSGNGTAMWEVRPNEWKPYEIMGDRQPKLPVWMLNWSSDGGWLAFSEARTNGRDIWMLREKDWWRKEDPRPVQLTSGPLDFDLPTFSHSGKTIYAVGSHRRGELLRYDERLHEFHPYLNGISVDQLDFTRDGQWVTYVAYPERTLWRSRVDGSETLKLTDASMRVFLPKWSPDGQSIAFKANSGPGMPRQTYIIPAKGGLAQMVSGGSGSILGFAWTADGRGIMEGSTEFDGLGVIDIHTGSSTVLPNSKHMLDPIPSPSGRYLISGNSDDNVLDLLDLRTNKRTHLVDNVDYPTWSKDEKFVYFNRFSGWEPAMYRVRVSDQKVEKLFDLNQFSATGGWSTWSTLAPDGSVLLLRDLGGTDLYAIEWATK